MNRIRVWGLGAKVQSCWNMVFGFWLGVKSSGLWFLGLGLGVRAERFEARRFEVRVYGLGALLTRIYGGSTESS